MSAIKTHRMSYWEIGRYISLMHWVCWGKDGLWKKHEKQTTFSALISSKCPPSLKAFLWLLTRWFALEYKEVAPRLTKQSQSPTQKSAFPSKQIRNSFCVLPSIPLINFLILYLTIQRRKITTFPVLPWRGSNKGKSIISKAHSK
jgi:hypothetical protein